MSTFDSLQIDWKFFGISDSKEYVIKHFVCITKTQEMFNTFNEIQFRSFMIVFAEELFGGFIPLKVIHPFNIFVEQKVFKKENLYINWIARQSTDHLLSGVYLSSVKIHLYRCLTFFLLICCFYLSFALLKKKK